MDLELQDADAGEHYDPNTQLYKTDPWFVRKTSPLLSGIYVLFSSTYDAEWSGPKQDDLRQMQTWDGGV
jgi:hypothetical protein